MEIDDDIKMLEERLEKWKQKLEESPDSFVCSFRIEMLENELVKANQTRLKLLTVPEI